jgi:hypothetical protein
MMSKEGAAAEKGAKSGVPDAGCTFVPAVHVGAAACGERLRVRYVVSMLADPATRPTAREVPNRPPEGRPLRTAAAEGARAGLDWPPLAPVGDSRRLLLVWTCAGVALVGALLVLLDLACVAPVAEEGGGWNASTTRSFLFSLLFMFVAGDVIKVLALTFLSASLLPGFLSPHARGLRLVFRGLNQVVKFIS